MTNIHAEIRELSDLKIQTLVRDCLSWRGRGRLPEESEMYEFAEQVADERYRGEIRMLDDLLVTEAARRFCHLTPVVDEPEIPSGLASEAADALREARRYGAGDWQDLETRLRSI